MNKKLNTWIAIGAALAVIVFLFWGNLITGLFGSSSSTTNGNPTGATTTQEDMNITTGVKTTDEVVGTGPVAAVGDTVTVNYVGTLTNGTVFDSSIARNQPFTFHLGAGEVIRGWDEGLVGMRVGGTRKLTIAPDFAYGDRAVGPIPANSILIFEVNLLNVAPASTSTASSTSVQ